ncbi:hypothetical protein D3C81_1650810 [compost metagenome]
MAVFHLAHRVDPDAGGIDHAVRAQPEGGLAQRVLDGDAADHAALLAQAGHAHVVDRGAAHVEQRAHQRHRQPRIVELAVEVQVAAAQRPSADVLGQVGRRG